MMKKQGGTETLMDGMKLNGAWEFRKAGEATWRTGHVPGTLLTDLLALSLIPEPYIRDHEYELMPLFEEEYEYCRRFILEKPVQSDAAYYLRFEGLDTLAEVTLNGHAILNADNMFRTYEIEVSDWLEDGENRLHVRFGSPVKYMREKQRAKPLPGIPMTIPGYTHVRLGLGTAAAGLRHLERGQPAPGQQGQMEGCSRETAA